MKSLLSDISLKYDTTNFKPKIALLLTQLQIKLVINFISLNSNYIGSRINAVKHIKHNYGSLFKSLSKLKNGII